MNKLPVFRTPRLILRDIDVNDAFEMFEYSKLPNVGPMAGWEPHKSIAESMAVINLFITSLTPFTVCKVLNAHIVKLYYKL